ncbi:hypothetical protein DL98DRAFT_540909 [Cadophora sp. DSE1049]|nr:hypothetical protein DL98DRAFT_540909 [Cadophora sp. DSE1049]
MTAIDEHMASIVATTSYFEGRLEEINSKLQILLLRQRLQRIRPATRREGERKAMLGHMCSSFSERAKASSEDKDVVELQQGREDKSSKQECIQIQSRQATGKVYTNVFEDVLAAQGSYQIIPVASANVLSAVRVTTGAGAK